MKTKITVVAILLCIFLGACSSGKPAVEEAKIVPEDVRETTESVIGKYAEELAIDKLEMLDSGTIWVQLAFLFQPESQDDVEGIVLGLIDKIELQHNYDLDFKITAVRHIEGTDKLLLYGSGVFYTTSGKLEYREGKA